MPSAPAFPILTTAYLGVFGLLLFVLVVRVALSSQGGRASKILGRFVGGSPVALILMMVIETRRLDLVIVHVIGSCLILGRVLLAFSMNFHDPDAEAYRMQRFLTWVAILTGGAYATSLYMGSG